jgi:hypothetical protein
LQRLIWLARQPRKVAKSHRPFVKVARNNMNYSIWTLSNGFSNCRD